MAGILIIAHAPFATALRDCISHIYGGLPARIGVIDVSPDCDPAQQVAFAHSEIERLKEENGALVLTDMFGATPANIAARLASVPNVRVLCWRQSADAGARGLLSHDAARHAGRQSARRGDQGRARNRACHAGAGCATRGVWRLFAGFAARWHWRLRELFVRLAARRRPDPERRLDRVVSRVVRGSHGFKRLRSGCHPFATGLQFHLSPQHLPALRTITCCNRKRLS